MGAIGPQPDCDCRFQGGDNARVGEACRTAKTGIIPHANHMTLF